MEEQVRNKKNSNNMGIILIVTTLISLICGALGAFVILQCFPNVTESVIKNITEETITETSIADAVDKVYDAVVVVKTYSQGKLYATGTGFVYKTNDKTAYIMTNNHVIDGGDSVKVLFTNNQEEEATIVGGETYSDIAVLSVSSDKIISTAELGETEDLRVGDTVFTVGSPEGAEYAGTVTKGIISGKDRLVAVSYSNTTSDYYMKVLQTDAAINPGNSGGPICNINGEVIGITNMKLVDDEVEGMGFAIPIEDALYYAAIIETEGKVTRPYVGISMLDVSSDSYYLWQSGISIPSGVTEGVVVYSVEQGSPADKAKLQKGDIITSLGGESIESLAEFRYELYKHSVGEEVEIKYIRDGKEATTKITLGKSNS
jgi:serine protease Do